MPPLKSIEREIDESIEQDIDYYAEMKHYQPEQLELEINSADDYFSKHF